MPSIQPIHLILILIIALVIFGPSRLPQLGKSLGESITEFRHATKEMNSSLKQSLAEPDSEAEVPAPEQTRPSDES